jgi:hypothetical protein
MKLLITTQVYENYGYRWKPKGGCDYTYALGKGGRSSEALLELVECLRGKVECDNEGYREHLIGWEVVADDYLTEFEQSQLDYDGEIRYPAKQLEIGVA